MDISEFPKRIEPEFPDEARRPEYSASWRVLSDDLDLPALRAELGDPTRGHSRGDLISPARNDARRGHSLWLLESGLPRTEPLEAHIEVLLSAAEGRHSRLLGLQDAIRTDFFCGVFRHDQWVPARPAGTIVFGCGFELSPPLLARLAALDMTLSCDIY